MKSREYIVENIKDLTNSVRHVAFNHFGKWNDETDVDLQECMSISPEESEELNRLIPYAESRKIVRRRLLKQKHKYTNKVRYIMSEDNFFEMISDLNTSMVSGLLAKLASQELINVAFDDEVNDFVFWTKEEKTNDNEENKTPKTN